MKSSPPTSVAPFVEARDLRKTIGNQEILRGVTFDVASGETLVILGASGGGKSVLLRHILGLMRPDSGTLRVDGTEITELSERELFPVRRKIGMLFQDGALFDSMTVAENVAFPLRERGLRDEREISDRVEAALAMVGLGEHLEKMPVLLSGGMRKRVALARAAVTEPLGMLYDEPTAGLDPIASDSINQLIRRLRVRLGVSAIVVTHDLRSAYEVAQRIIFLREGSIYFEGTPDAIRGCEDPVVRNFIEGVSGEKP
jgi:phospholipid/cholesterol/gamma-HCH transport system ATP-binding protein